MNPALQTWLHAATRGLAPESAAHIRQAYAHSPEAPGESPTAANRRFKKRYATQRDLAQLESLVGSSIVAAACAAIAIVTILGVAAAPILFAQFDEGAAGLTLLIGGLMLFCLILGQWDRPARWAIRRYGVVGLELGLRVPIALTLFAPSILLQWSARDMTWPSFIAMLSFAYVLTTVFIIRQARARERRLRASYSSDEITNRLAKFGVGKTASDDLVVQPSPPDAQHRPKSY